MCNLETSGPSYSGCGHYEGTKILKKLDCGSIYCMQSICHLRRCPHCPRCERYYGPDAKETITCIIKDYCPHCDYWIRGPGSRPHPQPSIPGKRPRSK